MNSWTLFIPAVPPSANVFLRMHWSKRKRLVDQWDLLVDSVAWNAGVRIAKKKRVIHATIYRRRLLDAANLHTGIDKLVFDSLVRHSWLIDDSPEWLTYTLAQEKSRNERTEIVIEETC